MITTRSLEVFSPVCARSKWLGFQGYSACGVARKVLCGGAIRKPMPYFRGHCLSGSLILLQV